MISVKVGEKEETKDIFMENMKPISEDLIFIFIFIIKFFRSSEYGVEVFNSQVTLKIKVYSSLCFSHGKITAQLPVL